MIKTKSSNITLVLFIFFQLHLFAQNQFKADSLIKILKKNVMPSHQEAKVLCAIAYYHTDLDSALFYANRSRVLAKQINASDLEGEALEEISNTHNRLGNTGKSIAYALQALRIYDSLQLNKKKAAVFNQLATTHLINDELQEAIAYFENALEIYNELNIAYDVQQVSTILNLGESHRLAGNVERSKQLLFEALDAAELIRSPLLEAYSKGNLGMVFNAQDSLGQAKTHLMDAIPILKEMGDAYSTSVYLAELGAVYQKENKSILAEEKYVEAITMAREAGLKEQIRDFSEKLSHFYETQGNYNKALSYQKLFQVYQDSLVNKANIQQIEQLKSSYEIDRRETEISLLNKVNTNQKYLVWILSLGVLATLTFLYLLYRGNQRVKKANMLLLQQKETIAHREQEKALLLKELNHRVKNNLQMISSLLNLQSRELEGHPAKEVLESGKDRVEALSLVHRKLYQEGAETKIALREYVEELVLGLFYGYEAKFQPKFEIEEIYISIDTAIPLALIINELTVNSLKYAYVDIDKPSFVLKVKKKEHLLIVQAIDNGKGFTLDRMENKNSFGLKLMDSLIEQLEGTLKKQDGKGTHWRVQLKVA
ncbi:MAG: histidine kinase dimerization/phosphoacceptor domain -containing protein [Bacteroidota bacterium]|nr:histidine kinase dimerization/phosphoacceptor domain -containing protein [Bacteroidota bacterium]